VIELASELLTETGTQIEHHEAEIARLQQLRASLLAFIDQPDQDSLAAGPAVSVGSPAPVAAGAVRSGAASATHAPAALSLPPGERSPATQQPKRSTAGRSVDATKGWVECPECRERVRAQGLGVHRSRSKAHAAAVNGPTVLVRPAASQQRPAIERNPRTTPPLDLPRRLDTAVGE
jgi:hypothetical protein